MPNPYHEDNRQSWNAATRQHHSHKPDLINRYKEGWNNLYPEDMELLGNLTGKSVVHLQCNDGQDTLSIARHVGGTVTGVDISDEAINFARRMSDETGIHATFIRSDIFDWFEKNTEAYDVVYTSYGAINWISSIREWAQGIMETLKPGGKLVLVEFHPLIGMYENDWTLQYDYMGSSHEESEGVGDYVGDDYDGAFQNPHRAHEFCHGIGDIISAVLRAGLTLTHFKEYDFINGWKRFPVMRTEGRRHYLPDDKPTMALMFSLVAIKPES